MSVLSMLLNRSFSFRFQNGDEAEERTGDMRDLIFLACVGPGN